MSHSSLAGRATSWRKQASTHQTTPAHNVLAAFRSQWDQGQPGDILGFPGHVAIYLGSIDGQRYILEASWVGTPIHVVPLTRTNYDKQLHRYWTATHSA